MRPLCIASGVSSSTNHIIIIETHHFWYWQYFLLLTSTSPIFSGLRLALHRAGLLLHWLEYWQYCHCFPLKVCLLLCRNINGQLTIIIMIIIRLYIVILIVYNQWRVLDPIKEQCTFVYAENSMRYILFSDGHYGHR